MNTTFTVRLALASIFLRHRPSFVLGLRSCFFTKANGRSAARTFAAAVGSDSRRQALAPQATSAWGQRVVKLQPSDLRDSSESSTSHQLHDVTEALVTRGLPELKDIKEGVAFFHVRSGDGNGLLVREEGETGVAAVGQRAVSVPVTEGRLLGFSGGSVRVLLDMVGSGDNVPTVAVTWNGEKSRVGSSHVCATRDHEVNPQRKQALDKALAELNVDIDELLDEEQVTGSGSSALRSYFSFIQPRPGKKHEVVDRTLELSASRAASQIHFLVRAYRAEQSEYLRNHDQAMKEREASGLQVHPLTLVLDNVRSAYNVGSIFRTAETALLKEVLTTGITPHPPHSKLLKTACRSLENVPNRHFSHTIDAVRELKAEGVEVWAMETTSRSEVYTAVRFPKPVALILGNEVTGVDTEVMELCDKIVEIPTFGQKNSLNVASACPVVVFEVLRQWGAFPSVESATEAVGERGKSEAGMEGVRESKGDQLVGEHSMPLRL